MKLTVIMILVAFATPAGAETYRLVHAIGSSEHLSAKGLTKNQCEAQKRELQEVAKALRIYDPQTGRGSITCLPESIF